MVYRLLNARPVPKQVLTYHILHTMKPIFMNLVSVLLSNESSHLQMSSETYLLFVQTFYTKSIPIVCMGVDC